MDFLWGVRGTLFNLPQPPRFFWYVISCIALYSKNNYVWTREELEERKISCVKIMVENVTMLLVFSFSIWCQRLRELIFFLPFFFPAVAVICLPAHPGSLCCHSRVGHLQVYLLLCEGRMLTLMDPGSSGLPSWVSHARSPPPFYAMLSSHFSSLYSKHCTNVGVL